MTFRIGRLDQVATVRARIGWKALTASEYQDEGYVFLSTPNIKGSSIDFSNVNYISEFRYRESPELMLQRGDVLLAKDGSTLGIAALVRDLPREATVNGSIAVLRPHSADPSFLRYVMESAVVQGEIQRLKDGMGVPHLFQWDIRRLPVPLPPLDVQRRIADFLDDQVKRLNDASRLRAQQLDLTVEGRQAKLENLVLGRGRGDSRPAQWSPFGQVPSRWAETRLRSVPCTVATGPFGSQLHAEEYVSGGYPVVNPANISPQGLVAFENITIDRETRARLHRHVLDEDDIVFARRGELGRAALVTHDQVGWVCGTGSLVVRLRGNPLIPAYLVRLLQTAALRFYFDTQAVGSTMANLNTSILLSMPLLLPPTEDQLEVLQQCDQLDNQFRTGEAALRKSLGLLEERKRSLITAAVTGEFDITSASPRAAEVALAGTGGAV